MLDDFAITGCRFRDASPPSSCVVEESGAVTVCSTGLPVSIADDPLCSVVLGTGKMLSDFKLLRKISIE